MEVAVDHQKQNLHDILQSNRPNKVNEVLAIYKACGVDEWAASLKEKYYEEALQHLDDVAVMNNRKEKLKELAGYLLEREN